MVSASGMGSRVYLDLIESTVDCAFAAREKNRTAKIEKKVFFIVVRLKVYEQCVFAPTYGILCQTSYFSSFPYFKLLAVSCWQLASHEYLLQFCFTNYNKWLEASSQKLAAFSYLRLLKFLGIIHEYHGGPGDRIH
jgi:hypothetical protein